MSLYDPKNTPPHVAKRLNGSVGSKFSNPVVRQRVLEAAQKGASIQNCAHYAGIHPDTLSYWIERGKQQIDESGEATNAFGEFLIEFYQVRADSVVNRLDKIEEIGTGQAVISRTTIKKKDGSEVTQETYSKPEWTALAWKVERVNPEYSLKQVNFNENNSKLQIEVVHTNSWRGNTTPLAKENADAIEAAENDTIDAEFSGVLAIPA